MIQGQTGLLKGIKPIVLDGEVGYFVRRNRLIMMRLADLQFIHSIRLPIPKSSCYLAYIKLLERALRLGVQCGVKWRDTLVLAAEGRIISIRSKGTKLTEPKLEAILDRGRSPLNFCVVNNIEGFEEGVYYGEYFSNPSLGPVAIKYRDCNGQWTQVFEFAEGEINHIHNLIPDPIRGCVWILTGDFEGGAAIWMARNNFSIVDMIVRGSQEVRACVAFPLLEGLLYATDSQIQDNSIRILEEVDNGWTDKKLYSINGPVIFGTKVGEQYVFSTATEPNQSVSSLLPSLLDRQPGQGIYLNESQVIIGSVKHGFSPVLSRAKDALPYRLFQFGNILFPSGASSDNRLYMYSIANRGVGMSTEVFQLKY